MPGLRAPGAGSRGKAIADDDVVMSVQAKRNFIKNPTVFIVGNETLAHDAIFIANIKPNARATIAKKTGSAPGQHHGTTPACPRQPPSRGQNLSCYCSLPRIP